jgi:hypothetical protein
VVCVIEEIRRYIEIRFAGEVCFTDEEDVDMILIEE